VPAGNGWQKHAAVENVTQNWEEVIEEAEPGLTEPSVPAMAFAASFPEEQAGTVTDQRSVCKRLCKEQSYTTISCRIQLLSGLSGV